MFEAGVTSTKGVADGGGNGGCVAGPLPPPPQALTFSPEITPNTVTTARIACPPQRPSRAPLKAAPDYRYFYRILMFSYEFLRVLMIRCLVQCRSERPEDHTNVSPSENSPGRVVKSPGAALTANRRYVDALAAVDDPTPANRDLDKLTERKPQWKVRRYHTTEGKVPLSEWLDGLRDGRSRARIVACLDWLKVGLSDAHRERQSAA
jgi:hypothetical protein